jgi:RimJ/RimL family protein N-acetyltransferase
MQHPFLVGPAVYLRGIERADMEGPLFQWGNDEETTRYLFMGTRPNVLENLQEWYDEVRHSSGDIVMMAVDRETDAPIGFAGLHRIEWVSRTAEYRVFIGEAAFRGRHLGQQIGKLLVRYAFEKLNMNKVWLGVNSEHAAAIGSYERAGFVREGTLREEIYRNSRYYDAVRMSILRSEYCETLKARYDTEIPNPAEEA